jgi:starch synthase
MAHLISQRDPANAAVHLATAGRFHALSLAREFARLGRLGSVEVVTRPGLRPSDVPNGRYHNHLGLGLLLACHRKWGLGLDDAQVAARVDRATLRRLRRLPPGIFHGWNGHMGQTFLGLRSTGWLRCVERSCPHNQWQHDLLVEEAALVGVPPPRISAALAGAIEELYEADVIVAPSRYSAQSYSDPELIRKVRVNPLGANVAVREPSQKPRTDGLTILMIGNAFLRKGSHWLIQALQHMPEPTIRVLIRGDVPADYRARITDSRVEIVPPLPRAELLALYDRADVFVLPSIDEGFGMVVLEALGMGLPVVVTENVGAGELLTPDVSRIVPIRSPERLATAIREAATLPETTARFATAQKAICSRWTWSACAERMLGQVYVRPEGATTA